ncbi:MAG: glycerol-3-phosphate acyltransferase [Anaerolineaceae bacterium]
MDKTIVITLLIIVLGYLLGSIPSAYIIGHLLKGRDLRHYGSGTVSGSMVYEHVARWAVIPVGLFDVAKAALPAWLAMHLGLGEVVAVTGGLAAAVGHNWPIFLNFTGGRGISTFLGLLLVVFPWGIPWLLVPLAIGYLLKDSPPFALFGMGTLPLLTYFLDGAPVVVWGTIIMLVITILKRLEANRRPLPESKKERRVVLLRRLFLDRDIASHADWINRRPTNEKY